MTFSGDRTPGASGPTGAGPASQRRSLVLRGWRSVRLCLQGRRCTVNRGHAARRGSEQRTRGHPSLGGSRGGGGARDSPCPNARAIPEVHSFIPPSIRRPVEPMYLACRYRHHENGFRTGDRPGRRPVCRLYRWDFLRHRVDSVRRSTGVGTDQTPYPRRGGWLWRPDIALAGWRCRSRPAPEQCDRCRAKDPPALSGPDYRFRRRRRGPPGRGGLLTRPRRPARVRDRLRAHTGALLVRDGHRVSRRGPGTVTGGPHQSSGAGSTTPSTLDSSSPPETSRWG